MWNDACFYVLFHSFGSFHAIQLKFMMYFSSICSYFLKPYNKVSLQSECFITEPIRYPHTIRSVQSISFVTCAVQQSTYLQVANSERKSLNLKNLQHVHMYRNLQFTIHLSRTFYSSSPAMVGVTCQYNHFCCCHARLLHKCVF